MDNAHIRSCAQTVASDFLPTVMRKPSEIRVSMLRCAILNAISFGITDEDFGDAICNAPGYRADALAVRDAVGPAIGDLIVHAVLLAKETDR